MFNDTKLDCRELKEGSKDVSNTHKPTDTEHAPTKKPVQLKFLIPEDAVLVIFFFYLMQITGLYLRLFFIDGRL